MNETARTLSIIAAIAAATLLAAFALSAVLEPEPCCDGTDGVANDAVEFTASDIDGQSVSLNASANRTTVLLVTNIEYPLCVGCADYMAAQAEEVSRFTELEPNVTVISLNLRYNAQSQKDGREILRDDFGVNVTWSWIEEFSPYTAASNYVGYWSEDGMMYNPTVIVISDEFKVVSSFRVYQALDGPVDGVVSAEELSEEIANPGNPPSESSADLGLAVLFSVLLVAGVATLMSPCSLATMMLAFSAIRSRGSGGARRWWSDGVEFGLPFTLGMVAAYFILGLAIGWLGGIFIDSDAFYLAGGIVMIAFGVNSLHPFMDAVWERVGSLGRKRGGKERKTITERMVDLSKRSSVAAVFLLGLVFSVGMAPCALSLTLPVLVVVSFSGLGIAAAGVVLSGFGVGRALPILALSFLTGGMRRGLSGRFIEASAYVSKIVGAVIIVAGILFAARFFGIILW